MNEMNLKARLLKLGIVSMSIMLVAMVCLIISQAETLRFKQSILDSNAQYLERMRNL